MDLGVSEEARNKYVRKYGIPAVAHITVELTSSNLLNKKLPSLQYCHY